MHNRVQKWNGVILPDSAGFLHAVDLFKQAADACFSAFEPSEASMIVQNANDAIKITTLIAPHPPRPYQILQANRMPTDRYSDTESLRTEIAVAAARMIAEDGADYGSAKRKAAKQILGDQKVRGDLLPDNARIEDEVRLHNALFFGDTQPARLLLLRNLALQLMQDLAQFTPYLTGAVLNGTAGEHSDIRLQLFTESAKDVEIFLLNKNIQFEVSESPHFRAGQAPVETVSFLMRQNGAQAEGVHLSLYHTDDLRSSGSAKATRRPERANAETLRRLMQEQETT
jgi:hypothetical protein